MPIDINTRDMLKKLPWPALVLLPAIFLFLNAPAQDVSFRFMFYNVENLFDTSDDTATADNDFLPGGLMRWNNTRYLKKLSSVYKTIAAAGEWHLPDVIALCEVENRKVLEDLITRTNLLKHEYGIIHADSPDERGIDVAILYRKSTVKIFFSDFSLPSLNGRKVSGTRYLLHAACVTGTDTLHFLVNHWPSRRGGVLAGEETRIAMAEFLKHKADSISGRSYTGSKIIIAGDFNCTPGNTAIEKLLAKEGCTIVNPADGPAASGAGTYRYKGTWEMIDQVMISEFLLDCSSGLSATESSFRIFRPGFLLISDPAYPGLMPFSTYRGYKYQGGFSDHLPVLLDLFVR